MDALKALRVGERAINANFARARVYRNLAIVFSAPFALLTVSALGGNGNTGALLLMALFFSTSALAAWTGLPEQRKVTAISAKADWSRFFSSAWDGFRMVWREGLDNFRQIPGFAAFIALCTCPFAAWVIISWFWPLLVGIIRPSSFDTVSVGWLLAAVGAVIGGFRVVGSLKALKVLKTGDGASLQHRMSLWVFLNLSMSIVAGYCCLAFDSPWARLLGFLVFISTAKALEEIVKSIREAVIHGCIESPTARAATASFVEMMTNLVGFVMIVAAVLSANLSGNDPFIFVGQILIGTSLLGLTGLVFHFLFAGNPKKKRVPA